MNAVAAVLAGHLIGDWVLQSDWQAANKVRPGLCREPYAITFRFRSIPGYWGSWRANQQHMVGYHLALIAFVATAMSWRAVALLAVVSWLTHSLIDRRWPVIWLMRHTGSGPFSKTLFGVVATDQALHLTILLTLAGSLK